MNAAENGAGRQVGVFEDDVGEAAGDVEADEGFDPHTARAGGHEELRESAQRPGCHEDEIGRVGVLYESLRAPQSEAFARRHRLDETVLRLHEAASQRIGAHGLPRRGERVETNQLQRKNL